MKPIGKICALIGLIGLIIAIFSPLLASGTVRNKIELEEKGLDITWESQKTIQKAYAYEFSLTKGEKIIIEFGMKYENCSATLKILGKGDYDSRISANTTNLATITGKGFIYSVPNIAANPAATGVDEVNLAKDGFYYIEFMGARNGNGIYSIPGDYVIIIYATNPPVFAEQTWNKVDIKVIRPGNVELAQTIWAIVGFSIIIAGVVLAAIKYKKGELI